MRSGPSRVPKSGGSGTCVAWVRRRDLGNCPALLSSKILQRRDPARARLFFFLTHATRSSKDPRRAGATAPRRGGSAALQALSAHHLRCPRPQRAGSCPLGIQWSGEPQGHQEPVCRRSPSSAVLPVPATEVILPGMVLAMTSNAQKHYLGKFLDRAVCGLLSNWGSNSKGTGENSQRGWNLCGCPTL